VTAVCVPTLEARLNISHSYVVSLTDLTLPISNNATGRRREPDDERTFAHRQMSGIMALIAIAEPETTTVPFSGTGVRLRYSGALEKLDEGARGSAESAGAASRWSRRWRFNLSDQMLRNSLYLLINSGAQSGLGFVFWIIAARFFSPTAVGLAGSLYTTASFISFFGLMGLNIAFLRYLPVVRQRNKLITAGLVLVASFSGLIAVVYVFLMPVVTPPISFITHSLPLAAGFVILTAGSGLNSLTDAVFIAAGKANYNAVIDGVIGGAIKIIALVALVGGGAYAIFGAAAGGLASGAVTALLLMTRMFHWRPQFGDWGELLGPILRFSSVNYVGSVFSLLPALVVPLIVIDRIGKTGNAYYYIAFQLANLIYQAAYSVEQAFLVEGATEVVISRPVLMRSIRVLLALCIPSFLGVILFGHQLLAAFGSSYSTNAEGILIPLTVAVIPIAANNWFLTVLRLSNKLKAIVWSNVVYAVGIMGPAWVLAPHGLIALALAWPIGTSAAATVSGVAAMGAIRRNRSSANRQQH
jgi:O-antigen/teichoic acid export membrane protein